MGNGWYSKKWTTVAIHSLAWIILFSLPALLFPAHNPNEARENHAFKQTTVFFIARTSDILLIGFFYLNAFLLIPAFLYKRKYFNLAI